MRRDFRFLGDLEGFRESEMDPITHSGCSGMKTSEIGLFQFRVKHADPMVIFGVWSGSFQSPNQQASKAAWKGDESGRISTGKERYEHYEQSGIEKHGKHQSASSQHGREECLGRLHTRCRPCDSGQIRLSIRGGKLARGALDTPAGCLNPTRTGEVGELIICTSRQS